MKNIAPPEIDDKVLFDKITKSSRHKENLTKIREYIFCRYDVFEACEENLDAVTEDSGKISKEDKKVLLNVYKGSGVFEDTKSKIRRSAGAKCPFCDIGEPSTIEHYFPKTIYPEYALFSKNLLPCCSYCNSKKGDRLYSDRHIRRTINLYFDNISDKHFLQARIWFENGRPCYEYELLSCGEKKLDDIITEHFRTLNLIQRYKDQSNDLMCEMLYNIHNAVEEGDLGFIGLKKRMKGWIENLIQRRGQNYWVAVFYEAAIQEDVLEALARV